MWVNLLFCLSKDTILPLTPKPALFTPLRYSTVISFCVLWLPIVEVIV